MLFTVSPERHHNIFAISLIFFTILTCQHTRLLAASVKAPAAGTSPEITATPDQCHTPGLADQYLLALSWQPAFCESHREKPECRINRPDAWQASHFTLHGLWPNQRACDIGYGFCGRIKKPESDFCHYPPVPFRSSTTLDKLGKYMPGAAHGSCLQRHEWFKHGTCQTIWNADQYFTIAMELQQDFNRYLAPFMAGNTGKTVSTKTFFTLVDQAFGPDAHQRLKIHCTDGNLVDIFIYLPGQLEQNDLGILIQQAAPAFDNSCGEHFRVDALGQDQAGHKDY